jgi:hypothetical protein
MIKSSYVEPIPGMPVSEYPYIARSNSVIIMVTDLGNQAGELSGFVISSSDSLYKVGMKCDRWTGFARWDGVVTLTNFKG